MKTYSPIMDGVQAYCEVIPYPEFLVAELPAGDWFSADWFVFSADSMQFE